MTQIQLRHPDVSPTMDMVAKKIFHTKHITADFIRSVLKIPVESVEILDGTQIRLPEPNQELYYTAIDVLAQLDNGTKVIIEVQVARQKQFYTRLIAYMAEQWHDDLNRAKNQGTATHQLYRELNPVYTIALLTEDLFLDDRPFRTAALLDEETIESVYIPFKGGKLKQPFKFAFLELNKYNKNREKVSDYDLQKWFQFFSNSPYDLEPDAVVQEAEEYLNRTHWTEDEKTMYDQQRRNQEQWYSALEQARDDGMELGVERGIKQGIEQGIYQVASTMLKQGFELSIIASATGLSETEIQLVAQENLV